MPSLEQTMAAEETPIPIIVVEGDLGDTDEEEKRKRRFYLFLGGGIILSQILIAYLIASVLPG